jgi:hypothetical protein
MKQWQYQRISGHRTRLEANPRLFISGGKYKGKFGTYENSYDSKISIKLDDSEEEVMIGYVQVEELDEYGQPKVLPVMDMTGREITIDSYICYSVPAGRNSHAMEIGKVFELTKVGAIKVRTVVRNGEKTEPDRWRRGEVTVNNPFRSIKLPVDPTTMLMWIMQDFDELAKQK